jgi:hypothetical protein
MTKNSNDCRDAKGKLIKLGDTVKYAQENPDEIGTRYKVLEVSEDIVLIEYVCNWNIRPTCYRSPIELEIIE